MPCDLAQYRSGPIGYILLCPQMWPKKCAVCGLEEDDGQLGITHREGQVPKFRA